MARTGGVYQRLKDSYTYLGAGYGTTPHREGVYAGNGQIFESDDLNLYHYGTNAIWVSAPSGYAFTGGGADFYQYGNYLYALCAKTTDISLYRLNITTKSWTSIKTWPNNSGMPDAWLAGPAFLNDPSGLIMLFINHYYSAYKQYLEVLNPSTGTVTFVRDIFASDSLYLRFYPSGNMFGAVAGDTQAFYCAHNGSGTNYLRKVTLSTTYTGSTVDSIASPNGYHPCQSGYHVRTDTPTRLYNEARSTYWVSGVGNIYQAIHIGTDGSDEIRLMITANGLYIAALASGGASSWSSALHSFTPYANHINPIRGIQGGEGVDVYNPPTMHLFSSIYTAPSYCQVTAYKFALGRSGVE